MHRPTTLFLGSAETAPVSLLWRREVEKVKKTCRIVTALKGDCLLGMAVGHWRYKQVLPGDSKSGGVSAELRVREGLGNHHEVASWGHFLAQATVATVPVDSREITSNDRDFLDFAQILTKWRLGNFPLRRELSDRLPGLGGASTKWPLSCAQGGSR